MTLTLTIPAPAPWINTNTRMHRMAKANLTKQWREICPKIPGNTRNFGRIETAPKVLETPPRPNPIIWY